MSASAITRTDVKLPDGQTKLAFVLENVLTPQECDEYIKRTEKKGYEKALVNVGGGRQKKMTDVRNSGRCIIDSTEEADMLYQRIKDHIPQVWARHKALGLNERLRFLRYDKGEYFKPHFDGQYRRDNGERSYVTVQFYLNEGFEGGATTFMCSKSLLESVSDHPDNVPVIPKTGSALIFQHDILHEGSLLVSGRKYAVRTDVMFSAELVN